ncbi:hypothetical protein PF007_g30044 [Phytophthora fragariae]|uniref:RxLR effector protein n=3 Tax=Phytophthora fragariae TaxID=53985 RepID=A0A6A3PS20_9STRA|nr:hypothetical protein PF003_g39556 [Phytophthora fragariae]KAE9062071.1 hypothetical protein PF007_g30044 [Phytophthora fragariae]
MQPYCVLVIALVACVANVPVGVGASLTASTSSIENPNDVHARMLLREGGEDGEERIDTSPSLLSKLENALTGFTRKDNTPPEVRGWMKKKKTPDDVFKALKLDDELETVLDNEKLHLWVDFVNKFNKKNRGEREVTILGMLTKTYGDEALAKMLETAKQNPSTVWLATKLQNEQQIVWMLNGLSPDFVFKWFKLDKGTLEELLSNPALGVWYHFFHGLNQFNPDRDVTMITKFVDTYGDIPLAKAISAAMKDGDMQLVVSRLQEAQFQKWRLDGRDPGAITKLLLKDRMGWKNQGIFRAYNTFYEGANKVDDLDTSVAVASLRRS